MSVPLFVLDEATIQLAQDGFDTMIELLGKESKIILPGDPTPCPNCFFDAHTGRSSGTYNGTGPRPFTQEACPVCRGEGFAPGTNERVETRKFTIRRNIKPSVLLGPNTTKKPGTIARIKGYATDLPLILQAKYFILDYQNTKYMSERYVRLSHPTFAGSIVNSRYFICFLELLP